MLYLIHTLLWKYRLGVFALPFCVEVLRTYVLSFLPYTLYTWNAPHWPFSLVYHDIRAPVWLSDTPFDACNTVSVHLFSVVWTALYYAFPSQRDVRCVCKRCLDPFFSIVCWADIMKTKSGYIWTQIHSLGVRFGLFCAHESDKKACYCGVYSCYSFHTNSTLMYYVVKTLGL